MTSSWLHVFAKLLKVIRSVWSESFLFHSIVKLITYNAARMLHSRRWLYWFIIQSEAFKNTIFISLSNCFTSILDTAYLDIFSNQKKRQHYFYHQIKLLYFRRGLCRWRVRMQTGPVLVQTLSLPQPAHIILRGFLPWRPRNDVPGCSRLSDNKTQRIQYSSVQCSGLYGYMCQLRRRKWRRFRL